jgi:heterodisulfide reductase subunit A-like polyferredoxin
VRVVLCTCNDSVHHRDVIGQLAEQIVEIAGVVGASVVNAACQQEGVASIAAGIAAGDSARVLLAACLCCPLEILCGSCTHQRARAKEGLFSGEGISPELVETVNLRDEVLNQRGLDAGAALAIARRVLAAGVARALSAGPRPACDAVDVAVARSHGDRPAPFPLPGAGAAAAHIAEALCRGCGTCARQCPQEAIAMHARPSGIPLARVEPAACTLCGRCLAVCPVGAPDAPFAGHASVRAALAAAFAGE